MKRDDRFLCPRQCRTDNPGNRMDTDSGAWFCVDCHAPERHDCDMGLEWKRERELDKNAEGKSRRRSDEALALRELVRTDPNKLVNTRHVILSF